jgi:outer membrane protein OmpA-like peptidoglycan-associated protein
MSMKKIFITAFAAFMLYPCTVAAQDQLPRDNGLANYHTSPRYRESESHPLRVAAYVVHPIGWVAREVLFRPLSYFASSTPVTRSVMGYREPFDYRQPECFSADDRVPDCRSVTPFNYDAAPIMVADPMYSDTGAFTVQPEPHVYFPDVNFDFDVRRLNNLGEGRVRQLAQLLQSVPEVTVVLQGHTDYIGAEDYNERLGMDRAEAVRQQLVALGVSPERLSTVSFGEGQPVFTEQEDWARAVNRRVEVHVSDF